jgi:hypothetical protein
MLQISLQAFDPTQHTWSVYHPGADIVELLKLITKQARVYSFSWDLARD